MAPYQHVITTPNAWTSTSIGGKAGLTQHLTPEQIAGFDTLLARTRQKKPQEVTRADFDHPAVNALAAELAQTIRHGRGAVLLTGLSADRYSEEDLQRIYWGIGTHLGTAAVQSSLGDRLGHVRHVKDDPVARGYRSNEELTPHTDSYPIVGLLCLQRAETGGYSRMVSALAIHNEILRTRPDLLPALYEGYYYAVVEARFSASPVTEFRIPVFGCVGDRVSVCYSRHFIDRAAELRGEPLPPATQEALDYFDALADRDDLRARFMLEPGEMMLWHNFQMLHARDSYEDSPQHTRHLVRLWLKIPDDHPMPDVMLERAAIYERVYRERSGRAPATELETA
ncbi:MAG: TauD/TfdA family dioxygenase [Proteobacteria bacterium]|nr:TauD/TfdA family dioxygenase [Pseudomonadota bacterium]